LHSRCRERLERVSLLAAVAGDVCTRRTCRGDGEQPLRAQKPVSSPPRRSQSTTSHQIVNTYPSPRDISAVHRLTEQLEDIQVRACSEWLTTLHLTTTSARIERSGGPAGLLLVWASHRFSSDALEKDRVERDCQCSHEGGLRMLALSVGLWRRSDAYRVELALAGLKRGHVSRLPAWRAGAGKPCAADLVQTAALLVLLL
jgi:hypothetical protein